MPNGHKPEGANGMPESQPPNDSYNQNSKQANALSNVSKNNGPYGIENDKTNCIPNDEDEEKDLNYDELYQYNKNSSSKLDTVAIWTRFLI